MRRNRVSKCFWLAIAVVVAAVVPAARGAAVEVWQRPVPGGVARPFRAPLTRYGPGHLGVDFVAEPGTAVRAAGVGTVVFAGVVAGARHVVVAHPGGLRTSYSFLASIGVVRGQTVGRGQIVGTSGGRGEGHEGSVLHFGLRIGEAYVDPMRLFAAPDLAAVVHLAPVSDATVTGSEARIATAGVGSAGVGSADVGIAPAAPDSPAQDLTVASGRRTTAGAPEFPR